MTTLVQTRLARPELLEDTITPWLGPLAPWTRKVVVYDDERARNWFLVWVVVSLLVHLALFMIPVTQKMGQPASGGSPGPMTVRLANPVPRTPPVAKSEPPKRVSRPDTIIATRRPASRTKPFVIPKQSERPQPQQPTPPPQPVAPPEEDMMARINARRAARAAENGAIAQENAAAAAASDGPSLDQRIAANINRAKPSRTDGTGGVFEIKFPLGVREGSFKFNGWNPAKDNWHESYTVDAGIGGNVKLAIVKKVIEVIRKYKTGDFEFESHRLGRPVPMSARPADNDRLEAFLMQELFAEDAPPPRSR